MPSSGMLQRVTLVRTHVSEERIASIIQITRIGELGTTLFPEDGILLYSSGIQMSTNIYAIL
jgi:hypothetical protein